MIDSIIFTDSEDTDFAVIFDGQDFRIIEYAKRMTHRSTVIPCLRGKGWAEALEWIQDAYD